MDKRANERPRLLADFGRNGLGVNFFRVGDGRTDPPYDHVDIAPPPNRGGYPAWSARPNSYNAFLSFRKIVAKAQADGVETILILEDDAYPTEDFTEGLARGWVQVHQADSQWEMLYLGANHTWRPTVEVTPGLLRLNGSGCWHAVILHERVFDKVLALPMDGPIDGMAGDRIHPRGHCYAVWPNIALTRPGYSFCEGNTVDYSQLLLNKGCP